VIQGLKSEREVLGWLPALFLGVRPSFPRETTPDPHRTMQRLPRALCGSLRPVRRARWHVIERRTFQRRGGRLAHCGILGGWPGVLPSPRVVGKEETIVIVDSFL
jgi:hypothetical protein